MRGMMMKNVENDSNKVIFEYDHMGWFGNSYNLKLLEDGTLIRMNYGYSKLGPEDRLADDELIVLGKSEEFVIRIKEIYKQNQQIIKSIPSEMDNLKLKDGADETVKFGRKVIKGSNMFALDWKKVLAEYKEESEEKKYYSPFYELQKLMKEVLQVFNISDTV